MKSIFTQIRTLFPALIIAVCLLLPNFLHAQYFPPPYNVDAVITNDLTIQVEISWNHDNDTLYYFRVERDGTPIGNTTDHYYYDYLTEYGTYCYDVYAVYFTGTSAPAGPACVDFYYAEISIDPEYAVHWLWPDQTYVYYVTIENIGSAELYFEFSGYSGGFIEEVDPSFGTVPPFGGVENVMVKWNSTGYAPGTYSQDLIVESNSQWSTYDTIVNIMHVYEPAYVSGVVTELISQQPIAGVKVAAADYVTYTLADGSYLIWMDEGFYDLCFYKAGYVNYWTPVYASAGDTLNVDVSLETYATGVNWVTAEADCNDPAPAYINWSGANWYDEIMYDDGGAEDMFIWSSAGGENAVKYTPSAYPAEIISGSFFAGDGSFPAANWMGTPYEIFIYNENATGFPGTKLDSFNGIVTDYGWLDFYFQNALIDSGNFFISMHQVNPEPYSAPLGVDLDAPTTNLSYSKAPGGSWQLSAQQDFMIRAVQMYNSNDSVTSYTIARMSDFDPWNGPATGTMTIIKDTFSLSYVDHDFQYLAEDWYAYAVKTNFDWGSSSPWTYSNIMGMDMGKIVDFTVEDCLGNPIDSCDIYMVGQDYPCCYYSTSEPYYYDFDCVFKGLYEITVSKPGYTELVFNAYIANDTLINGVINPVFYQPYNLWADSITSTIYWEVPLVTALSEDFNGYTFPPGGWQTVSNWVGWFKTEDGGFGEWTIPPWDSQYACVNDYSAGSACCGDLDYLITPAVDLKESDSFIMTFDSFYDQMFGILTATVEYSLDAGDSWDIIHTMDPHADEWTSLELDLSGLSGQAAPDYLCFGFHSDDNGSWGSGWAIDNVEITGGKSTPDDYTVYLEGDSVANTDTLFYQFYDLNYGQTYTACVAANYACGSSDMVCVDFMSGYLRAPLWLEGDTLGTDVGLSWFMDTTGITGQLLGFRVFRDTSQIAYIPFSGEDTASYLDVNPDPMCYDYFVNAVHDLETYGYPGDTGESVYTGPEEVCLVYGTVLPVFEDWSSGNTSGFWTFEDNWDINGQFGNPYPCAEFTWDPILSNYTASLTSGPINGVYMDSTKQEYLDGKIILDFDLRLDDNSSSGTEYFRAEVWSDGVWKEVFSLSNEEGSFDWEFFSTEITDQAMGSVFRIRFVAEGENSMQVLSWFVDNIEIFHYCAPPTNLITELLNEVSIELTWSPPVIGSGDEWIMWDDGVNVDGIGLTGGGVFSVASKWDADMITQYDGQYITKIRFFPYQNVVATTFTLKVWEGPNAGTMIYEQAVSGLLVGDWNEVVLTTPVAIDVTQELWFGYTVDSPDGENPAGFDDGPAVAGYGDMISLDGNAWDPIGSLGAFDLNWNLQACVGDADGDNSTALTYVNNADYRTPNATPVAGGIVPGVAVPEDHTTRALLRYNVYWNEDGTGYNFLEFTEDTTYLHVVENPFAGGSIQCYYVSAVYENCEPESDEACQFIWVGIEDITLTDGLVVYPNPATERITIQSREEMQMFCLLDLSGRVMECEELQNQTQTTLHVSSYEAGVYLLRIDTEQGEFVRKIIIAR